MKLDFLPLLFVSTFFTACFESKVDYKSGCPSLEDTGINYAPNELLKGTIKTEDFYSPTLEENRKYTLYLPPNHEGSKELPLITFTDGKAVETYGKFIDKLIEENRIRPIALLGIHSISSTDYKEKIKSRLSEYVYQWYAGKAVKTIFKKHETFFLKELTPEIQEKYSFSAKRANNYLFGVSNGGAFVTYAGLNYPQKFSKIIAFSIADYISKFPANNIKKHLKKKEIDYPYFVLSSGNQEQLFTKDNIYFAQELERYGHEYEYEVYDGGHDGVIWRERFLNFVVNEFKQKKFPDGD